MIYILIINFTFEFNRAVQGLMVTINTEIIDNTVELSDFINNVPLNCIKHAKNGEPPILLKFKFYNKHTYLD